MDFGPFLGENKLPLGGNTLGFVLGRGRTLEEEEEDNVR